MNIFLKKINNKAFTLIELLVVVAIIAVLTAVVTGNLAESKKKARDAKRVSDLAQIQLALELFFDRCNSYTPSLNLSYTCPTNSNVIFSNYIGKIPVDPIATQSYTYTTNNSAPYTDYVLKAVLETNSQSLSDDIDGASVSPGSVNCDDSSNSYSYCVKPK